MKKAVITGIGAITPTGLTFKTSWKAIMHGQCGIAPISRFDASRLKWRHAGEVKGFDAQCFMSKKDALRYDLSVQYAIAVSKMALEDSGLIGFMDSAVVIGTSRGGICTLEKSIKGRPTSYTMAVSGPGAAASAVSISLCSDGLAMGISNACASGSSAIGEAIRLIRHGYADIVLAGGTEAPICKSCIAGYGASGALSEGGRSVPFDETRDGFVISEGAAMLVLEEMDRAIKRGARIYCEAAGHGSSSDARHITAPYPEGQSLAMRRALKDAGIMPDDICLISAHATSTLNGDACEAQAITDVFGRRPYVFAPKASTGHMLGASGGFEAALSAMSIKEGIVLPTAGMAKKQYPLKLSSDLLHAEISAAICDSFGFGGANSVLVLKKI